MSLPAEVQALLDAQPAGRFSVTPEGKIKCELNGHTLPAKADALQAFLNGKKYAKLAAAADLDTQLAKYEPFIVKSKNLPGMLFCALTGELLNARLAEVKQHLKGKKFARAQERFQNDEQELLEEPDMEGSGMEEDKQEGSDGPGVWIPEEVLQEYEMGDAEAEDAEAAAAGAAEAGAGEAAEEAVAAAEGGKGKGKGKAAPKQQKAQRQRKGKGSGGTAGDGGAGGKGKQRQGKAAGGAKQQAAAGGSPGGGGKAKAPKAKKARTG